MNKYLKKIMVTEKIPNLQQLANKVKMSLSSIADIFDDYEMRKELTKEVRENASGSVISETRGLSKEDRKKTIEYATKKDLGHRAVRELTKKIKTMSEPEVKKALLSDEISIEQAQDLTKISSPKAREEALREVKQHKRIADIIPKQSASSSPELTDAAKGKFNSVQKVIFKYNMARYNKTK